jgi:archaellin
MKNNNENKDNLAAIGIGAMIVFIALILVAAVAAAVIIQTAEKLQQNAQSTGDDTTDEMSGKVNILNVFVADADNFELYFRLAAGSDDTADVDMLWQITCDDGAGDMDYIAGDFSGSAIDPLDGNAAVTTADAGVAYRTTLDATVAATDDCGPDALFTNNVKATLYIHVVGGGTTYDILKVSDDSVGAVVV